jgi:alpha-tubulin suppressor-like RCC1 family protein
VGLSSTSCSRCGSKEHASDNCPHKFFSTRCERCGSVDHAAENCPRGGGATECSRCGSKEHASDNCPHKFFSTRCERCGSVDHAAEDCPRGSFSIECERCGSKNHNLEHCPHRLSASPQSHTQSSSDNGNGCAQAVGYLVGVIIVIAIVVWLAVNVVLPVVLLNSAVIFVLVGAFFSRQRRALFAMLALGGACYMVLDISNGWFSANFVKNVVGDPQWITVFVYLNAVAVGVSTWVLVLPLWSRAQGRAASRTRRDLLLAGGSVTLAVVAAAVVPVVYHRLPIPIVDGSRQSRAQLPDQPAIVTGSGTLGDSQEQQTRRAEASRSVERARVEREIVGEWRSPDDPAGTSIVLAISGGGSRFDAEHRSAEGVHRLGVTILADGQLLLRSNQVGKFVNPMTFWEGDFSQEAWLQLSSDGGSLVARFSEAAGGRSVVLTRLVGDPASRAPAASSAEDVVREAPNATAPGSAVAWVSAGTNHTCEVTTDGAAYCWGRTATIGSSPEPVAIPGGLSLKAVSAGDYVTCWLTTKGSAHCSGRNDSGQLGDGRGFTERVSGNRDSPVPTSVAGGVEFSMVSVGKNHACGLTTSGLAYCWGDNGHSQLGNFGSPDSPVPVAIGGGMRFGTVGAGNSYSCAVATDGAAYCWGGGDLGNDRTRTSPVPVAVAGGLKFAMVTASIRGEFACGLTRDGAAYCWGEGPHGELGTGTAGSSPIPVAVAGGLKLATLSAGAEHACGVTTGGEGYCWGDGGWGQLGTGTTKSAMAPAPVAGHLRLASVSSGWLHTCGVTAGGGVYCWGRFGSTGVSKLVPFAMRQR